MRTAGWHPQARPAKAARNKAARNRPTLCLVHRPSADELCRDFHVLEIARLVVDADARRRDPARELARLGDGLHQALDEVAVRRRRQPLILVARPAGVVDDLAL